jgi:hypothetical protein
MVIKSEMKARIILPFSILFLITYLNSFAQVSGLKGNWSLDRTISVIPENYPALVKLNIRVTPDSLLTVRVYESADGQQYPFDENVSLNGNETRFYVYDMPRKSKAAWSAQDTSVIFESVTTFTGNSGPVDLNTKEIWKVDNSKAILVMEYRNSFPQGESTGKLYFKKSPDQ